MCLDHSTNPTSQQDPQEDPQETPTGKMAPHTRSFISPRYLLTPGRSVNNSIPRDLDSLQYVSVDDATPIIMNMGCSTQLAKVDVTHAFHNVLIHPDDRYLLGMQWENQVFIDTCLSFGLCLAPKIFSAISDTL